MSVRRRRSNLFPDGLRLLVLRALGTVGILQRSLGELLPALRTLHELHGLNILLNLFLIGTLLLG